MLYSILIKVVWITIDNGRIEVLVMARRIACAGVVLMAAVIGVGAQEPPIPAPTPTPYLGRPESGVERTRRLDRDHARLVQQSYNNLYGQGAYANSPRFNPEWRAKMVSLYRKLGKTETGILEPEELYRQEYSEFLREKNTGLFKLVPDQGCEADGIVSASPDCLKFNFPGAGASYSFRLDSYRIRRLADITLVKDSLVARGALSGAIFVELGDIPIGNVGLNTAGIGFLSEYKPVKTADEALEAAKLFAKGVERGKHVYGRGVYVSKNNTFALRSIAYRGKYMRSESGVAYNELDFDKRRDVIVVFRIVDLDDDGAATIVWKVLRDSKSPKLKINRE